jgi:hypothetical protein
MRASASCWRCVSRGMGKRLNLNCHPMLRALTSNSAWCNGLDRCGESERAELIRNKDAVFREKRHLQRSSKRPFLQFYPHIPPIWNRCTAKARLLNLDPSCRSLFAVPLPPPSPSSDNSNTTPIVGVVHGGEYQIININFLSILFNARAISSGMHFSSLLKNKLLTLVSC